MKTTKAYENYIAALVLVVAMCFAFFTVSFTAAHAEETTDTEDTTTEETADDTTTSDTEDTTDEDGDSTNEEDGDADDAAKRAVMVKQIEALKVQIAARKQATTEAREERKEEYQLDKDAFMARVASMDEDAKRAAMLDFISVIKARIAEFKAAVQAKNEAMKQVQAEKQLELRTGLADQDRITEIMERITAIREQIREREAMEDESDAAADTEDDSDSSVDDGTDDATDDSAADDTTGDDSSDDSADDSTDDSTDDSSDDSTDDSNV